jgi:hypothetical protein
MWLAMGRMEGDCMILECIDLLELLDLLEGHKLIRETRC